MVATRHDMTIGPRVRVAPISSFKDVQQKLPMSYSRLPDALPSSPKLSDRKTKDDYEKRSKQFKMRAVSFESYAFISALLFGFSCMAVKWDNGDYTLFRDAQLTREEDAMIRNTNASTTAAQKVKYYLSDNYQADMDAYEVIFLAHMFCMTVCCSLSIYSTMVFAMCSVYLRTGLAIGKLDALHEFLDACQFQRNCAFKAFLLGAALLPGDIVLVTFANLLQHGHGMGYIVALLLPATTVACATAFHILKIISVASSTVFAQVLQNATAEEELSEDESEDCSDRATACSLTR